MSISKEDYLGEIYRLQLANNRAAKVAEIAKALNISKPSVSQMIRKLSKEKLISFERYSGVTLTKEGIERARSIVRKHQLLEVFFKKLLKIKKKFHHEAHKLEHSLSAEAADRLEKVLKNPSYCPDGHPIPKKGTEITELTNLPEKSEAEVLFSTANDKQCIDRLNSLGLVPKTKIKVLRKMKKGPVILSVKGSEIAIGGGICSQIYVVKK